MCQAWHTQVGDGVRLLGGRKCVSTGALSGRVERSEVTCHRTSQRPARQMDAGQWALMAALVSQRSVTRLVQGLAHSCHSGMSRQLNIKCGRGASLHMYVPDNGCTGMQRQRLAAVGSRACILMVSTSKHNWAAHIVRDVGDPRHRLRYRDNLCVRPYIELARCAGVVPHLEDKETGFSGGVSGWQAGIQQLAEGC